jgi:hypothetical protein
MTTTKTKAFTAPQAFEEGDCPDIAMVPVESNQVARIGHCAITNTLAVQFKHGAAAIYHYHDVPAEKHADFMASDSKGQFFKEHIKPLAFKKYPGTKAEAPAEQREA